jgi:anaerobic dimethyl sulfoxide reductase subunit B (iron-sulfur subunit)
MQLAFFIDQTRCVGCHTCVVACKDWHDLPAELVSRRRVITYEEGKFPNVEVSHVSVSCNHCRLPACAEACSEEAIVKREADGIVLIDAEKCTACRVCENACPYGAIQFRTDDNMTAEKCNFCLDRLENGETPVCVSACPMRALDYGFLEDMSSRPKATTEARRLPDTVATTAALFFREK